MGDATAFARTRVWWRRDSARPDQAPSGLHLARLRGESLPSIGSKVDAKRRVRASRTTLTRVPRLKAGGRDLSRRRARCTGAVYRKLVNTREAGRRATSLEPQHHVRIGSRRPRARTRFIGLDAEACRLLTAFWPTVEPELPGILDGFYQHVTAVPHLKQLVGDQIPRLKQAQTAHWQRLFSGRFDAAYFAGVQTIGLMHHRIGLEPRWYIGGYTYVLNRLVALAVRTHRWSPGKARRR